LIETPCSLIQDDEGDIELHCAAFLWGRPSSDALLLKACPEAVSAQSLAEEYPLTDRAPSSGTVTLYWDQYGEDAVEGLLSF
jgi:hypothetical protein